MTKDDALKLALEALMEHCGNYMLDSDGVKRYIAACNAIEEALAQPEERNFCLRCGKRTNDIHTCTPPQPINWADHEPI